jgi:hypothetical protein
VGTSCARRPHPGIGAARDPAAFEWALCELVGARRLDGSWDAVKAEEKDESVLHHVSILDLPPVERTAVLRELCGSRRDLEWWWRFYEIRTDQEPKWIFSPYTKHMMVSRAVIENFSAGEDLEQQSKDDDSSNPVDRWNRSQLKEYFQLLREMGKPFASNEEVEKEFTRAGGIYAEVIHNIRKGRP